ncbi:MAG TPA: hypothetical protein PLU50_00150 [Pseudobdellovibrionaceae bacterium]|nr:hypothetical protein [Pseudobdellovibrionaceae bacterium]
MIEIQVEYFSKKYLNKRENMYIKNSGLKILILTLFSLISVNSKAWVNQCIKSGQNNYYLENSDGEIISAAIKKETECLALAELMEHSSKRLTPKSKEPSYFDINGPDESIGFPLKKCEVKKYNYHLVKSEDGYLLDECAPDTLYSWGGADKAKWFRENLSDGKQWPSLLPRSLYTIFSPAGSFGYGIIPLRFKIKPGVRFMLVVNPPTSKCEEFKQENIISSSQELRNTIITRLIIRNGGFSFLEHIICSPEVIESWSYGYTYHYDEILADHDWITTHHFYHWESYSKQDGKDKYLDANIDKDSYGTDFSLNAFRERMAFLKSVGAARLGYLAAEAGEDYRQKRQNHFRTQKPIYFNPE